MARRSAGLASTRRYGTTTCLQPRPPQGEPALCHGGAARGRRHLVLEHVSRLRDASGRIETRDCPLAMHARLEPQQRGRAAHRLRGLHRSARRSGAVHPVVRTHPASRGNALFLGRRRNAYMVGLTLDESEALLDKLWAHAANRGSYGSRSGRSATSSCGTTAARCTGVIRSIRPRAGYSTGRRSSARR